MKLILDNRDFKILAEMGILNDVITAWLSNKDDAVGAEVEEPKEEPKAKKKNSKKQEAEQPKEEPKVNEPKEEPKSEAEQPKEEVKPEKPKFSLEQVAQKAIGLMDAGKGEALQGLLQKFGVSCLPELQPECYAEFYAALEEI